MEEIIERAIEMITNNGATLSLLIAIAIALIIPVVIALIKRKYVVSKNMSYVLAFGFSLLGAMIADLVTTNFNIGLLLTNFTTTFTISQGIYHFVLELLGWKEKLEDSK